MEDSIVIKVIHGNEVRRFNARIINKKLVDLSFDRLKKKIASLFSFDEPLLTLLLTYIDEDGDVVTLADDEDLQDIVNQSLNPLRITTVVTTTKLHDQSKAFFTNKGKDLGAHSISEGSTDHFYAPLPSFWGPTPLPFSWNPNNDQFPWGPNPPEAANINITKAGKDVSYEDQSISTGTTNYFAEPSIWGTNTHFSSRPPFPPFYSSGAFTPLPSFEPNYNRSITGQNDGSEIIYHHGIRCDGCGVRPITGPRFMSKEKTNYDLCTKCFSKMGKDTDYFKQDRAMECQPHMYHQVSSRGVKVKSSASNLDSEFVMDVNMFDGTTIEPLAPFSKIWRMRNNGKVAWPHKTKLVWVGGDNLSTMMSRELNIPVTGWGVGQELDVFVDFVAPELPGRYVSYWRMASPYGKRFGQRIWVVIQVDASLKQTSQPESVCGLNLNIPPIDIETVSAEPNSTAKDEKQNLVECPITFSDPAAPTCLPSFLMKGVVPEKCFEEGLGDVKDNNNNNNESYGFGDNEWDTILVELEEMGFDDVEMNKVLLKKNNGCIKHVVMDLIDGEAE